MSNIIIVEDQKAREEREFEALQEKSRHHAAERARMVRRQLLRSLKRLAEDLDGFEQSCMGILYPGGIDSVAERLKECWHNPGKVTVQMLVGVIEKTETIT